LKLHQAAGSAFSEPHDCGATPLDTLASPSANLLLQEGKVGLTPRRHAAISARATSAESFEKSSASRASSNLRGQAFERPLVDGGPGPSPIALMGADCLARTRGEETSRPISLELAQGHCGIKPLAKPRFLFLAPLTLRPRSTAMGWSDRKKSLFLLPALSLTATRRNPSGDIGRDSGKKNFFPESIPTRRQRSESERQESLRGKWGVPRSGRHRLRSEGDLARA
jgi:hypothetical protein